VNAAIEAAEGEAMNALLILAMLAPPVKDPPKVFYEADGSVWREPVQAPGSILGPNFYQPQGPVLTLSEWIDRATKARDEEVRLEATETLERMARLYCWHDLELQVGDVAKLRAGLLAAAKAHDTREIARQGLDHLAERAARDRADRAKPRAASRVRRK
jgi:hypothetical protein